MKSVLISIRPKWCEPICNLIKTIEVRKTRPKLNTPFKCYIYCTFGGEALCPPHINCNKFAIHRQNNGTIDGRKMTLKEREKSNYCFLNGKVIGEFVCDRIDYFDSEFVDWANNVAPAESTIDSMGWNKFLEIIHTQACITDEELNEYFPEEIKAYLWHISDLKIYDKPKELSEFYSMCKNYKSEKIDKCIKGLCEHNYCVDAHHECKLNGLKALTRPFQSWGYVESEDK